MLYFVNRRRWHRTERRSEIVSGRRNVSDDWMSKLPPEKNELFEGVVRRWEAAYAMLSVALNDAFSLCARGELVRARQQLAVASDLAGLLGPPLVGALLTMGNHAREHGTYSRVEPLNPVFFRGATAHRAASWSSLWHGVLFRERPRFLQKLRVLSKAIQELTSEFRATAAVLVDGTSTEPGARWAALDVLHFDLNTCLRETVVILKSFLCAVPNGEMEGLRIRLTGPPSATPDHPDHWPVHVPT